MLLHPFEVTWVDRLRVVQKHLEETAREGVVEKAGLALACAAEASMVSPDRDRLAEGDAMDEVRGVELVLLLERLEEEIEVVPVHEEL